MQMISCSEPTLLYFHSHENMFSRQKHCLKKILVICSKCINKRFIVTQLKEKDCIKKADPEIQY